MVEPSGRWSSRAGAAIERRRSSDRAAIVFQAWLAGSRFSGYARFTYL